MSAMIVPETGIGAGVRTGLLAGRAGRLERRAAVQVKPDAMRRRPAGALLALAIAVAALIVPAGAAASGGIACRIQGWSEDRQGLRVRAGPSLSARVLGRLPPLVRDGVDDYGPDFDIVEGANGWLRIRDVSDRFRPSDRPRRPVFAGTGWVRGALVRFTVQSGTGRAAPRLDAPVLVDLGEEWLTEWGGILGVVGCAGAWAEIRYRVTAGTPVAGPLSGAAWFAGICPDQRTTCQSTPLP